MDVVDLRQGLGTDPGPQKVQNFCRVPFPGENLFPGFFQGLVEDGRFGPFRFGQVDVAGAFCQTVRDGAADDLNRNGQVLDQAADDRQLLGVFFTKVGPVGPGQQEEFGADRGHAPKMNRARPAAKLCADPFHGHIGAVAGGVHDLRCRCENGSGTLFGGQGHIPRQVLGIGVQVFSGAELGGVDKNADQGPVIVCRSPFDQAQMAFVQIAHGRHQADAAPGPAPILDEGAQVFKGAHHRNGKLIHTSSPFWNSLTAASTSEASMVKISDSFGKVRSLTAVA